MKSILNKTTKVLLVTACAALLGLAARPMNSASATEGTSIFVSPAGKSVNSGDTFDMEIRINSDQLVRGAQFAVQFDPAALEVVSITEGAYLKDFASSHGMETLVYPEPSIDNDAGTIADMGISIMCSTACLPDSPTGEGVLAVITVRAKGSGGESELKLHDVVVSGTTQAALDLLRATPTGNQDRSQQVTANTKEIDGVTVTGARVAIGSEVSSAPPPSAQGGSNTAEQVIVSDSSGGTGASSSSSSTPANSSSTRSASPTVPSGTAPQNSASGGAASAANVSSTPASKSNDSLGGTSKSQGMTIPWELVAAVSGAIVVAGSVTVALRLWQKNAAG